MGRNKYPEQTVEKIIITAARLFSCVGMSRRASRHPDAWGCPKAGFTITQVKRRDSEAVIQKRAQYDF